MRDEKKNGVKNGNTAGRLRGRVVLFFLLIITKAVIILPPSWRGETFLQPTVIVSVVTVVGSAKKFWKISKTPKFYRVSCCDIRYNRPTARYRFPLPFLLIVGRGNKTKIRYNNYVPSIVRSLNTHYYRRNSQHES